MLAITNQHNQGIFEKVLRGKDGRLYTVCFALTEVNGQTRARIIGAVPVCAITGECAKKQTRQYLSLKGKTQAAEEFFDLKTLNTASPFVFNFDFFTSQMTRAPSFL